ncbi:MAG: insulinase family protein [Candidatus Eremiobacteraeota bacterium]|nr:insulinase family protein [Candidatus Eremiobacteraeota bacterium]
MPVFRCAIVVCAVLLVLTAAARPAHSEGLAVTRATLPNGLRVIAVRDPLAPVALAMLNYQVGANDQDFAGQAHALEHMMFRGSATLSQSQLADIAELLGGFWDADTQSEVTQYFFMAPSQYLDVLLRMEASRVRGLTLAQSDWNIERGAIKNEVTQDYSDPLSKLFMKTDLAMFAGTPYGNDGLGTLHSFDTQINAPQLRALYSAWYHPNNAIYVIVGDIDGPSTVKLVEKYFGSFPPARLPLRRLVHLRPLVPRTIRVDSDQPYTAVALAYRFPGYRSKDYAAGQMLENALSSQRSNLYALVASGKALQANFEDFDTHPLAGSAAATLLVPVTTKPDDALAMLNSVIDGYRRNGVPADLVDAEKRRAIAQAEFKANSIADLGFQWSQAVAVQGLSSPDDMIGAIEKVTTADVNRVLRTYVASTHEIVGIAAPRNAAAPGVASAAAAVGNENKPTLLHHDPLPDWAQAAFANITVPASTINPIDATLANGIRLIVVPQKVSHTVVVSGSIDSNEAIQAPPGKDGIADVTAGLLPFGTRTYDRLALRAQLDAISAEVTAGTRFSLTALSKDFDRGVQLLADEELQPAFPAAGFAAVKQKQLGAAKGVVASPEHAADVSLDKALYPPGDPAQRFATPESIASITPENVASYYASVYRPDMTTIVVVGNVDPQQAKNVIEKYFGGWTASGPKPVVALPAVPNNAAASAIVPDKERIQSQVRLVEVLSLTRADPDYTTIAVANESLGAGGSSILFHDVRDVHGLVYDVHTETDFGKNRSTFAIQYESDPSKIAQAQALIMADLKALSTTGLESDELARGKASLVSELPMRVSSFDGIANQLIRFAQFGLPLDQATIDARGEIAVTNAQIVAAVTKWLRASDFVRVILGPGPP